MHFLLQWRSIAKGVQLKFPVFANSLAFLFLASALLSAGGQFPVNFPKSPLNQLTE